MKRESRGRIRRAGTISERADLAWQFLRRNPGYRADYEALVQAHGSDIVRGDPRRRLKRFHVSRWKPLQEAEGPLVVKWNTSFCLADPDVASPDPHPYELGPGPTSRALCCVAHLGATSDQPRPTELRVQLEQMFGRDSQFVVLALNLECAEEILVDHVRIAVRGHQRLLGIGKSSSVSLDAYRDALDAWDTRHLSLKEAALRLIGTKSRADASAMRSAVETIRRRRRAAARYVLHDWTHPLLGRRARSGVTKLR